MIISDLLKTTSTLDAELLLAHILKKSREYLWAHPEARVTQPQTRRWKALLRRLQHGEPLAYLLGNAPFAGRSFFVNKHVLTPRPETELLVEKTQQLIQWAPLSDTKVPIVIVDVGTGSGCIIVTLAASEQRHRYHAIDISPHALAIAKKNAARHGVSRRIAFHRGSLLEPLIKQPIRGPLLIIANLPYGSTREVKQMHTKEPTLAIDGGSDGLDLYHQLFTQLQTLKTPWTLVAEIDPRQEKKLKKLLPKQFPRRRITITKDWNDHARILIIEKRAI